MLTTGQAPGERLQGLGSRWDQYSLTARIVALSIGLYVAITLIEVRLIHANKTLMFHTNRALPRKFEKIPCNIVQRKRLLEDLD